LETEVKRMKTRLFIIIALFVAVIYPVPAKADEATATSSQEMSLIQDNHSTHHYKGDVSWPVINKLDPTYVSAINAYYPDNKGSGELPQLERDFSWGIWSGTIHNLNGIRIGDLHSMSRKANTETIFSDLEAKDQVGTDPDDIVVPLNYYPFSPGLRQVAISKVFASKEKFVYESELFESIKEIVSNKRCRFFTVLYNKDLVTLSGAKGIGLSMILGTILGPNKEAGNHVGGLGSGTGFGSAKGKVWRQPVFKVIGWNMYVSYEDSKEFRNKGYDPSLLSKSSVSVEEIRLERIKFDWNSADIYYTELPKIEAYADYINSRKLEAGQHWSIEAGASNEGEKGYNAALGEKRAYNVAVVVARYLHHAHGWPFEKVREMLRSHTKGELYPKFAEAGQPGKETISPNREAYLVIVTRVSG